MNFEINGQNYILTFLPDEGSFALFAPDRQGMNRMKIVHDDGPTFIAPIEDVDENKGKGRLN